MKLKEIVKRVIFGKKHSSDSYIKYLRKIGVTIGEDCIIYAPTKTLIDEQYPWMIEIGDHVRITEGVKIITHDFSWSVLKAKFGRVLGVSGKIRIGNNVFIGMNAIITRNVTIGDNVVIGAGSVVTKDCESNGVYVGVPAKKIMGLEEFYRKRILNQAEEAKQLAVQYYKKFGIRPDKDIFHEYFPLFSDYDAIICNQTFSEKVALCMNGEETLNIAKVEKPAFKDYDAFMRYCFDDK